MKYKVGDKVRIISNTETQHEFEIGEIVLITNVDSDGGPEICHKLDMSDWWYVRAGEIEPIESVTSPNYRVLYEQEKALREAAEKMLCDQADMTIDEWMEAFNNYQQLKQKYGQDTGTPR